MAPTIVTRAQWAARPPRNSIATTTWSQRVGVAVHHSAGVASSTAAAIRSIQNGDMDSDGFSDVGYNWMVTQDGRLWEGRSGGWLAIGAHAAGQNTAWIGVCWLGHSGNVAPTPAALATIRWVVDEARRRAGRQLQVRGHGQVPGQATECPGSRLRAWIAAGLQTEEDDMPIDKGDVARIWNTDDVVAAPEGADPTNTHWWPANILRGAHRHAQMGRAVAEQVRSRADQLLAGQAAILAQLAGQDVAEAVRAELDRAAATERAERQAELAALRDGLGAALLAELGPALVAELGDAAGGLSAEAVEAAAGRAIDSALTRTSLTVAPVEG